MNPHQVNANYIWRWTLATVVLILTTACTNPVEFSFIRKTTGTLDPDLPTPNLPDAPSSPNPVPVPRPTPSPTPAPTPRPTPPPTYSTSEDFEQVIGSTKLDILIVEDTSLSMHSNRYELASKLKNIRSALKGIDWQLAITTTALGSNTLNGGLVASPSREKVLKPTTSRFDAKFDDMISMLECNESDVMSWSQSPCTIANEQPLRSTIAALNHRDSSQLLRQGVNTAVLYISDEDETPSPGAGPATTAQEVLAAYGQRMGLQQSLKAFAIIIRPGDQQCLAQETLPFADPGAQYGYSMDWLAQLTSGESQSICDSHYQHILRQVAKHANVVSATLIKEFDLKYIPIPGSVVVSVSPSSNVQWTVVGKKITFNPAPPANSKIQVHYRHY